MSDDLRIRQAVRAVLVTPDHSILLCRFEFQADNRVWTTDDGPIGDGGTRTVWALPGGGVDPGETRTDALHRELAEEVGLADVDPGYEIGPHMWQRRHEIAFEDGNWDGQEDAFFHVPVERRFEPRPGLSWEQLRSERMHELRWWTIAEIVAATGRDDGVLMAPRRLGELLTRLRDEGVPTSPIDTGV
ncbi:MAG: NUDIX domain-containing protein [Actinomycetota bacterium]